MKKPYEKPELEVTIFEVEDICDNSGYGESFGLEGTDSY